MKDFKDDTFLARWLNGELSDQELAEFKSSDDYALFQKIVSGTENIKSASFDQGLVLERIKEQLGEEGHSVKPKKLLWVYSAAASVVVLLSFVLYSLLLTPSVTEVVAGVGKKKVVNLPDGSKVVLNAGSTLSFSEDDWDDNRAVSLQGEAYFKVEKGSDFAVTSSMGQVTVLGTEFNVKNYEDFYEVSCYEGSVQVDSEGELEILKPKRGVRKLRGRKLTRRALDGPTPTWIANRSAFNQVPIRVVLTELKNQYGITFIGLNKVSNLTYTGGFPHDDLEKSLKLVLGSLEIDYQLGADKVVTLQD
ncbi:MAG: FecR domain-containing protein [Bacteroidota bacterium]